MIPQPSPFLPFFLLLLLLFNHFIFFFICVYHTGQLNYKYTYFVCLYFLYGSFANKAFLILSHRSIFITVGFGKASEMFYSPNLQLHSRFCPHQLYFLLTTYQNWNRDPRSCISLENVQSRPGHTGRDKLEDHGEKWLRFDSFIFTLWKQFKVSTFKNKRRVHTVPQCLSSFLREACQYSMGSLCGMEEGIGQIESPGILC